MAKKQWIIGSSLMILGVVFIVMAAVTPIIIENNLRQESESRAELTSSNKKSYWGKIPGKLKEVVFITYNFFHIENPDAVLWSGATPVLTEKNGYVYQEFSEFVDLNYDGKEIDYFEFTKQVKNKNCIWSNTTHPTDKITTINIGSFYEWNQLKTIPRQRMALMTFFNSFYLLTTKLSLEVYTRALFSQYGNFEAADQSILAPAGFAENDSLAIFNDPYYGLGSKAGFEIWVEVLLANVVSGEFVMPSNMTDELYDLAQYFTFTDSQVVDLFSGELLTAFVSTLSGVYNWYGCSGSINGMQMCDPNYLGSIQWSSSAVTLKPYNNIWTSSNSISVFWPYLTGFVEISSYLQGTSIGGKYPGLSFTPAAFRSLFFFNWVTGWPQYSPSTLMDVGKMNLFFQLAYANLFSNITLQFNLPSDNHSRVLWDYVNSIVDNTALQGKSDPAVYDYLNRGISSELGLGLVGSGSLAQFFEIFSVNMPFVVTALYGYTRIEYFFNLTCDIIIEDVLPEASYICTFPDLEWDNSTVGYQKWLAVYWYGLESEAAEIFMNISGLGPEDMEQLFNSSSYFVTNFTVIDQELKDHYNCTNYGLRCSGDYLGMMQLLNSSVSHNLPDCLELLDVDINSTTLYGLNHVNIGFQMPSEYFVFIDGDLDAELTLEEGNLLFSEDGLFTPQNLQRFFINIYSKNYQAITDEYGIQQPLVLANYLRTIINQYYFNGLITTKTVDEILFTYQDPLIVRRQKMSPLIGGNPTLSTQQVLLGKNQTREQWEYLPNIYKNTAHSGKSDISKTRKLLKLNGQSYLNYVQLQYLGEGQNGPVITYSNVNPWQNLTSIKGTNGWAFRPNLEHSTSLAVTQAQNCLSFPLKYVKSKTRSGFECFRFELDKSAFLNVTQDSRMANFYNYAPSGLINLTSVTGIPFFLSRPYFLGTDTKVAGLVTYTTPQYNFPDNYHTYFDIEKYSGVPLYQKQQFQYNFQLKPDIIFPNLAASSIQSEGYLTYLPVYFTQRSYLLTSAHINDHFEYITTDLLISEIVLISGLVIGCSLIIAALLYALKLQITKRRSLRSQIVSQTHQPILLA